MLRTYVAFSIDAHKLSCIFMSHVVFLCQQAFRRRLTRSPAEVARKSSGEAPRELKVEKSGNRKRNRFRFLDWSTCHFRLIYFLAVSARLAWGNDGIRTRSNCVELEHPEKRENNRENTMNSGEWSKLIKLDQTLTPNSWGMISAEHQKRF